MTPEKKRTRVSLYGQILEMKSRLPEAVLDGNPDGGRHQIVGNFPDGTVC